MPDDDKQNGKPAYTIEFGDAARKTWIAPRNVRAQDSDPIAIISDGWCIFRHIGSRRHHVANIRGARTNLDMKLSITSFKQPQRRNSSTLHLHSLRSPPLPELSLLLTRPLPGEFEASKESLLQLVRS